MLSLKWKLLNKSTFLWCFCVAQQGSCKIHVKGVEEYFTVAVIIMLKEVPLTLDSVDEILSVTIQSKLLSRILLWCCLLCSDFLLCT